MAAIPKEDMEEVMVMVKVVIKQPQEKHETE